MNKLNQFPKWKSKDVVIKKFNILNDEKAKKEFHNEIKLATKLNHPSIVRIYGIVEMDSMLGIVMDYALEGIKFLHSKSIIHRDLKPENILIFSNKPKISDFGVSRVKEHTMKVTKSTDSFRYSAPELFNEGNEYDASCDIYSLAMILYSIFAKKEPFDNLNFIQVTMTVMNGNRPEFPNNFPKELSELIKKGWNFNPKERCSLDQFTQCLKKLKPSGINEQIKPIPLKELQIESKPFSIGETCQIFKAKWKSKDVVIKRFNILNDEKAKKEFHNEINFATKLNHPSIVRIYGIVEIDSMLGIVMDYAGEGIKFLHSKSIIHRDLKPENILISGNKPKISDFGVSRVKEHTMKVTKSTDSFRYSAPELFNEGNEYDASCDIYSLAMILYSIFAKKEPFDNLNFIQVTMTVMNGNRPEFPNNFPKELSELIKKGWDFNPKERCSLDQFTQCLKKLKPSGINEQIKPIPLKELQIESKPFSIGETCQIFKAKWKSKDVVIKKFNILNDEKAKKEFHNEINFATKLNHPSIVRIYGIVEMDSMLGIVMDYALEGDLKNKIINLTFDEQIRFSLDIIEGIKFLHSKSIIHRDLKPENILIFSNKPKISDFGVSRVKEHTMKVTKTTGSFRYSAPELFNEGNEYDASCDIYSLAMILYSIFAKKEPFDNLNFIQVTMTVMNGNRPEFTNNFPKELSELIKKGWDFNPKERCSLDQFTQCLKKLKPSDPRKPHSPNRTISPNKTNQSNQLQSPNQKPVMNQFHSPNRTISPNKTNQSNQFHSPNRTISPNKTNQSNQFQSSNQKPVMNQFHSPNRTISPNKTNQSNQFHSPNQKPVMNQFQLNNQSTENQETTNKPKSLSRTQKQSNLNRVKSPKNNIENKIPSPKPDSNSIISDILPKKLENLKKDFDASEMHNKSTTFHFFATQPSLDIDILQYFIESGADLNQKDWSPVHYFCRNLNITYSHIELLAKNNSNFNLNGWTPLHDLCRNKSITKEIVELILEKTKANFHIQMFSPLHELCGNISITTDILKLLIEKGLNFNLKMLTPLHFLCNNRSVNEDMIKLLKETNANFYSKTQGMWRIGRTIVSSKTPKDLLKENLKKLV
ncbi:serine/threonine protein kinase [Anaeramoeba ignava]|uniref:Serine/threonine protein kinase n=1 Tax=Anaeramoeba ignava TaxID=1746090 RepID=A0A9Q0LJ58_ANAIG|nr:serine/threonine protein kinase [Anaeramoeba ignava]